MTSSELEGQPSTTGHYERLHRGIGDRSLAVAIVGLGYVGLPLANAFVRKGVTVIGFDVDPSKISHLNHGVSYLDHLGQELFDDLEAAEHFSATTDMRRLNEADAIIVAVPTPLGIHNEPNLGYVEETGRVIGEALKPGQLVILESTTYPGTTRGEFVTAIQQAHPANAEYKIGEDIFVGYSPEREDPGNALASQQIPKLVGGLDEKSGELIRSLYEVAFEKVVPVSSAEVGEAAKLLENIFRAVNIALVNEMKVVLTDMDINIWEVVEAASTKPFGYMPFFPGPGLGGHCIPIDPFYMTWKAKEVNRPVQFIELAGLVNERMPNYVVERVTAALNEQAKAVNGSRILVLGLAYKPDVADWRESPAFQIIEQLAERGADVNYSDPHIVEAPNSEIRSLNLKSVELSADSLATYDAVVIATDHSAFDYQLLADKAEIVVDTRNAMAGYSPKGLLVRA